MWRQAKSVVRIVDSKDGTSTTIAIGDAAGGTLPVRGIDASSEPGLVDQSWGAAGMCGRPDLLYGSVFAVEVVGTDGRGVACRRPAGLLPTTWVSYATDINSYVEADYRRHAPLPGATGVKPRTPHGNQQVARTERGWRHE